MPTPRSWDRPCGPAAPHSANDRLRPEVARAATFAARKPRFAQFLPLEPPGARPPPFGPPISPTIPTIPPAPTRSRPTPNPRIRPGPRASPRPTSHAPGPRHAARQPAALSLAHRAAHPRLWPAPPRRAPAPPPHVPRPCPAPPHPEPAHPPRRPTCHAPGPRHPPRASPAALSLSHPTQPCTRAPGPRPPQDTRWRHRVSYSAPNGAIGHPLNRPARPRLRPQVLPSSLRLAGTCWPGPSGPSRLPQAPAPSHALAGRGHDQPEAR